MPAAVLIRGGPTLYVVSPDGGTAGPLPAAPPREVLLEFLTAGALPANLVRSVLTGVGDTVLTAADPRLADALRALGRAPTQLPLSDRRRARERRPYRASGADHAFSIALARRRVERALASEEEALVALAREEERVERALDRDSGAFDQFLAGPTGPLAEYRRDWEPHRDAMRRYHERLAERVGELAERLTPNLAGVVGPRVAARLVASAGGVGPLGRMSASRLQVLGSRRRPGGGRGPRFGVIFRASRMADVPMGAQGRYARSLAALAVIAARADAHTHRRIVDDLIARRDRRVERLRRAP